MYICIPIPNIHIHTHIYMHILYLLGCFWLQVQNNNLQMYDLLIKKSGDNKGLSHVCNCYLLMSNRNFKHYTVRIELLISDPLKPTSPLLNIWLLKLRSSLESLSTFAFHSLFTSNPSLSPVWLSYKSRGSSTMKRMKEKFRVPQPHSPFNVSTGSCGSVTSAK